MVTEYNFFSFLVSLVSFQIDNSRQQRSFAVMDLFLKGIQEQLKGLMNPEDSSTSPENEEANT